MQGEDVFRLGLQFLAVALQYGLDIPNLGRSKVKTPGFVFKECGNGPRASSAHHPSHVTGSPPQPDHPASFKHVALLATLHCSTGCGIGEVAGMVIGTALGWGNLETIALAVALAFLFGYVLTTLPLLRNGYRLQSAARIALAADTASITVMEVVDNLLMLIIPGAMDASLNSLLFWGSLSIALLVAGVAVYPLNLWLIARGRGHAIVHGHRGRRGRD